MNEKELREEWNKSLRIEDDAVGSLKWQDYGCDGADECCGNCGGARLSEDKVFDWFINRIKERDERLNEKVLKFQWTHNRAGKTSMYVDDIIKLIDNHA